MTIKKYISRRLYSTTIPLVQSVTIRRGAAAAVLVMGVISYLAAVRETFPGDLTALRNFQELRSPWLDDAANVVSLFARDLVLFISILAVSIALWLGRKKADAVAAVLVFIPDGVNQLIKELVGRARPDFSILSHVPDSHAFPSGHAVHVFLFFGLLIFITGDFIRDPRLRTVVQVILVAMILACGASRVYLGVHWPSDVFGGFLFGGICLLGLLWVRKKLVIRGFQ